MTIPRQKRNSTASITGYFDSIKEMSPNKAVATSSPPTPRDLTKSATAPTLAHPNSPRYNPSRAYPRPHRVLPDESGYSKMRAPRTDTSFPSSLYSTPTIANSPLTAMGSRDSSTFLNSRRKLESTLLPQEPSLLPVSGINTASYRSSCKSQTLSRNSHNIQTLANSHPTASASKSNIDPSRKSTLCFAHQYDNRMAQRSSVDSKVLGISQHERSRLSLVDLTAMRPTHNISEVENGTDFGDRKVQFQPVTNIRARVSNLPTAPTSSKGHFSTRIPSPSAFSQNHPERQSIRLSSTPVLPSQKISKENAAPKSRHLLGQISPTTANRGVPSLPRAKTFGVFISLTSAFSRSSSRQASSSAQSIEDYPWDAIFKAPLLDDFDGHWSGRFVGKLTKFQNQELVENLSRIDRLHMSGSFVSNEDDYDCLLTDNDLRVLRVLKELDELCVTSEVKKSFWDWQLLYARSTKNEKFLPDGGTMINARGSWASRMGKALKQEGRELGKKTSMAFRTRNSGEDLETKY